MLYHCCSGSDIWTVLFFGYLNQINSNYLSHQKNLHIKCYSLIIVQVFTPGHVSSGKRCKCSSAHSAAAPKEKSQRLAISFVHASQFTISLLVVVRDNPATVLMYFGTYKYMGTSLIQARELWCSPSSCSTLMGSHYRPDSQMIQTDGAGPIQSIVNFDQVFPFRPH